MENVGYYVLFSGVGRGILVVTNFSKMPIL